MPPVFGPVSPSPMRLWSWAIGSATARGRRRTARAASTRGRGAAPPARTGRRRRPRDRGDGLGIVVGHGHALARGEAVELDDDRASRGRATRRSLRRRRRNGRTRGRGCRVTSPARGRTTSTTRVGRASAVGPKHGMPRRGALVGDTGDERRFGPRDHEIGVVGGRVAEVRCDAARRGRGADRPTRSPARAHPIR